ncbi:MAG: hypothetical protein WCV79_02245 [Candidatus Paceibacterota bacterium]|jgi:hypothetical protein
MKKQPISTIEELTALLVKYNVRTDGWGHGGTKSLKDLFEEIQQGTSKPIIFKHMVVRCVTNVAISVYYKPTPSFLQYLEEMKEPKNNGHSRVAHPGFSLLTDKLANETPQSAAERCLKDEFNIDPSHFHLRQIGEKMIFDPSCRHFPHLSGARIQTHIVAEMDSKPYKAYGYKKILPNGQTIHRSWKPVPFEQDTPYFHFLLRDLYERT